MGTTTASGEATARSRSADAEHGAPLLSVWHLGKFYPPASGGIESHVRALAQEQARLGLRVSVACVNHAAPDGRDVTFRTLARTERREERDGPVRVVRLGRLA